MSIVNNPESKSFAETFLYVYMVWRYNVYVCYEGLFVILRNNEAAQSKIGSVDFFFASDLNTLFSDK